MEKKFNSRIKFATGTLQDWESIENSFTPKTGELYIYTDYIETDTVSQNKKLYKPGIKIGLENKQISQLPFLFEDYITNSQIDSIIKNDISSLEENILGKGKLGSFILGKFPNASYLDNCSLDSLILG